VCDGPRSGSGTVLGAAAGGGPLPLCVACQRAVTGKRDGKRRPGRGCVTAMSFAEQVAALKAKGIPADKIDEYKAAFDMFDPDRSGKITVDKLAHLMNETFGQSFSTDDLRYMLQQFHESAEVNFSAFASTLHDKMGDPRFNEAFGDAFDLFDTTRTGELSKDDLQSGMLKLGERLTDAEAEEMLKIAKKKDEFVRSMTSAVAAGSGGGGGGGSAPSAAPAAAAPAGGAGPAGPGAGPPRPGAWPAHRPPPPPPASASYFPPPPPLTQVPAVPAQALHLVDQLEVPVARVALGLAPHPADHPEVQVPHQVSRTRDVYRTHPLRGVHGYVSTHANPPPVCRRRPNTQRPTPATSAWWCTRFSITGRPWSAPAATTGGQLRERMEDGWGRGAGG